MRSGWRPRGRTSRTWCCGPTSTRTTSSPTGWPTSTVPFNEDEFLADCLAVGQQWALQGRIASDESVTLELFKTALRLADHRGLLDPETPDLDKRAASSRTRSRRLAPHRHDRRVPPGGARVNPERAGRRDRGGPRWPARSPRSSTSTARWCTGSRRRTSCATRSARARSDGRPRQADVHGRRRHAGRRPDAGWASVSVGTMRGLIARTRCGDRRAALRAEDRRHDPAAGPGDRQGAPADGAHRGDGIGRDPVPDEPVARDLGIDDVLCTELEVEDGVLTGQLDGQVPLG